MNLVLSLLNFSMLAVHRVRMFAIQASIEDEISHLSHGFKVMQTRVSMVHNYI